MDYSNTYDPNLAYPTNHMMDTGADPVVAAAFIGFMLMFFFLFVLVCYVVYSFLLGRIFKKAGVPQWAAWVPVYNSWKMLELGGQQGFWAVLALIPIVNIASAVFMYIAMYHIGRKLGKEDWFVLLAIFLPIVWLIWLGFDDSKWDGGKKLGAKKSTAKKHTAS
jgi:hypothetical protein